MAVEIIGQLEPRIVIPMHYKLPGLKAELDPVEKFIKNWRRAEARRKIKDRQERFAGGGMDLVILEIVSWSILLSHCHIVKLLRNDINLFRRATM